MELALNKIRNNSSIWVKRKLFFQGLNLALSLQNVPSSRALKYNLLHRSVHGTLWQNEEGMDDYSLLAYLLKKIVLKWIVEFLSIVPNQRTTMIRSFSLQQNTRKALFARYRWYYDILEEAIFKSSWPTISPRVSAMSNLIQYCPLSYYH